MQVQLYKIEGYEAAIMALRMSKGKFYTWEKARDIQELVARITDSQGFIEDFHLYRMKYYPLGNHKDVLAMYDADIAEFKRLLGLTKNNAMGEHKHHTLMKYIDITFITEGLHRGAQDDLDAHAIAFNNRITRYSTRLADIEETPLSDFYQDKVLTFDDAVGMLEQEFGGVWLPDTLFKPGSTDKYKRTPWGYVKEQYAKVPAKNGRDKDIQRGLMPLGMESNAIWKIDLASLRYVYHMRSKLTKANPELKDAMEILADQLEQHLPVFGEHFRQVLTDSGEWEHTNKVKTVTFDEYQEFKAWRKAQREEVSK